jgi:hypothetical protein
VPNLQYCVFIHFEAWAMESNDGGIEWSRRTLSNSLSQLLEIGGPNAVQ